MALNQYAGSVFRVNPGGNTQNMGIREYMTYMGSDRKRETEFNPMDYEEGLMLPGSDTAESYTNHLNRANEFGMMMAAKGIDVTRPKNAQEARYAQIFQGMLKRAESNGVAARAEFEMAKQYNNNRLNKGVYAPAYDMNKSAMENMGQQVNYNPLIDSLKTTAAQLNRMVKTYDTREEYDMVNRFLDGKKEDMRGLIGQMVQQGLPESIATYMVESEINRIGTPTYNNMAQQALDSKLNADDALAFQRRQSGLKSLRDRRNMEAEGNLIVDQMMGLMTGAADAYNVQDPNNPNLRLNTNMFRGRSVKDADTGRDFIVDAIVRDEATGSVFVRTKNPSSRDKDGNVPFFQSGKEGDLIPLDIKLARELMEPAEYRKFEQYLVENPGLVSETGEFRSSSGSGRVVDLDEF